MGELLVLLKYLLEFLCLIPGTIPSSEVRANPRPAKNAAWSHGLLSSPIEHGTSSDNASDHSDKLESFGQPQGAHQVKSNNNSGRKRKIISNGCPTFMNSGVPSNRVHHEHVMQQKDNEPRNSIGQGN
jgi:hypothetical protein